MKDETLNIENPDHSELIAREMVEELLLSATSTGTPQQMKNAIDVCRKIGIYTLGSIIFNTVLRDQAGNLKDFDSHAFAVMDDLEDEILNEVKRLRKELEAGNLEYASAEGKTSPVKVEGENAIIGD